MSPPPTIMSPECMSVPLSSVPLAVAVRVFQSHTALSVIFTSSSVADPSKFSPIHLALLSALSPSSTPPTRYSFPAPALLTCCWPCPCPSFSWAVVVLIAAVVLFSAPGLPIVLPSPFPFLYPLPAPPPPIIPWDPAATRPALHAPSPVPGRRFRP